jgi:hypothetical protein
MLKKTAMGVAAAALLLGTASSAPAGDNRSGDYQGGALFGPMPGQIFSYGPGASYGYAYAPRLYGRGGRAFAYAPSLRDEFPNAPWEEY